MTNTRDPEFCAHPELLPPIPDLGSRLREAKGWDVEVVVKWPDGHEEPLIVQQIQQRPVSRTRDALRILVSPHSALRETPHHG